PVSGPAGTGAAPHRRGGLGGLLGRPGRGLPALPRPRVANGRAGRVRDAVSGAVRVVRRRVAAPRRRTAHVRRHHRPPRRGALLPLRLVGGGATRVSPPRPPATPETARLTPLVGRVLGLNPGLMTGPGTNTYLVGTRRPILLDTGAGVPGYMPLLASFLRSE